MRQPERQAKFHLNATGRTLLVEVFADASVCLLELNGDGSEREGGLCDSMHPVEVERLRHFLNGKEV